MQAVGGFPAKLPRSELDDYLPLRGTLPSSSSKKLVTELSSLDRLQTPTPLRVPLNGTRLGEIVQESAGNGFGNSAGGLAVRVLLHTRFRLAHRFAKVRSG